jgi:hypothetical protein
MSESLDKNKQKRNNFRTAFIRCNCDSELLVLRYDQELDSIDLCLFESQQSFNTKMSWRQKLRYIIQLFKTGQPFIDQILLDKQQINELKAFLNSL